ncbi:MAG: PhzF family phenazine biosynthesis protein [Verrucomicrobia bacterium]|nr:PhzF family phenazine biosynthesis protein [Verrucomicrobiota bacterium]
MKLPIYQIDAFADLPFQGNPAAVCPLDVWLPDDVLQSIAEENNLAETAFYVEREGSYDLRWFTPTKEVDLCGHATLAAAHVLFESINFTGSQITFQSRSGPLLVYREGDLLTLDFPAQPGVPCEVPNGMVEALGATPRECYRAMDYMAVFDSEDQISTMAPDFRRLKSLGLRGVIVTAPGTTSDFVSRFFAPNFGIDEDPVTGSAHCTLAPFWAERLAKTDMSARQLSKRTGSLRCRVVGDRVHISGRTVAYLTGTIQIAYDQGRGGTKRNHSTDDTAHGVAPDEQKQHAQS